LSADLPEEQPEEQPEEESDTTPQEDQREYFKAKYKEIIDIEGVGPATVTQLSESGFKTIESLATATQNQLIKGGIGEALADKIIKAARKAVSISFIYASELMRIRETRKYLTTGCSSLDRLLIPGAMVVGPLADPDFKGGIETEAITEFYGEYGSGKSQICHQLAVTAQLPISEGGLGGKTLYIDTEAVFQPERAIQIARRLNLEWDEVLENIVYAEAYTSEHQMALLEAADQVIKDENIKLIIVDSVTSHFRGEYLGREMLAPRQQKLNMHLQKIFRLSRVFGLAAVVTNQVSSTPDSFFNKQPIPIGGHIMGHMAHTRIYIRKGRGDVRIAKVVASPSIPESEAPFRITDGGIMSEEDLT